MDAVRGASVAPHPASHPVMKSICVFCGASSGHDPVYRNAAAEFGRLLGEQGIELVWGGGHVGLMGVVANAVLAAGGRSFGVIPSFMVERELAHPDSTELLVVDSMHTRKAAMAERADAFVALPGGFGTLDELFEIVTWAQLGLHAKPIGLLDISGFFQPLLGMANHLEREGFVKTPHLGLLCHAGQPDTLLAELHRRSARGSDAGPEPRL